MGRVGAERGHASSWLTVAALAGVLAVSGAARAQTGVTADDMARRHFESGVAYLEESDYDNALRAFHKAHELSRRAEILLNVSVVHERRGDGPGAIAALRQYMDEAPNNDDVETVALRIQNLEKRQAALAPSPAEPPTAPAPAPRPVPTPVPAVSSPPVLARPSRTPMFVAFGVGAIASGGAVLTGVLAQSAYDQAKSDCSPRCSDSELAGGRALALTSTLLTGVALAGVGVGVTLLLLEAPRDAPAAGSLALRVVPDAAGARASAAWSF